MMGVAEIIELYGQLGAMGIMTIGFLFLLNNLVRSQKDQSEDLDVIKQDISKMQTEINSVYSISVKLIDSINGFKGSINDKMDRRHEAMMKELDDLSDKISYMSGRINGGGKH
jgi:uncharacterized protein YoxC|tara:strand:+ start:1100 stop:1438 length:339 start_codon:yes stop_codon:yes gene_type:complete